MPLKNVVVVKLPPRFGDPALVVRRAEEIDGAPGVNAGGASSLLISAKFNSATAGSLSPSFGSIVLLVSTRSRDLEIKSSST